MSKEQNHLPFPRRSDPNSQNNYLAQITLSKQEFLQYYITDDLN